MKRVGLSCFSKVAQLESGKVWSQIDYESCRPEKVTLCLWRHNKRAFLDVCQKLLSSGRCWASVLHVQTPKENICLFLSSSGPTFTSYPHERVKKQRRPIHLHFSSWCLHQRPQRWGQTGLWCHGLARGLKFLALELEYSATCSVGDQRNAIYKHWVSELISVDLRKSLSMGIKVIEKEFLNTLYIHRSNLLFPNTTNIIILSHDLKQMYSRNILSVSLKDCFAFSDIRSIEKCTTLLVKASFWAISA